MSNIRKEIAHKLETELMSHMRPMGLSNVRFKVQLSSANPTESGSDSVTFMFSANPGQTLQPLTEIASGGEMSRFLLAFKSIMAEIDESGTIIF